MKLERVIAIAILACCSATLPAQQMRQVISTPTMKHTISGSNGVAKVDDESKPFTGKFIEMGADKEKLSEYTYVNGKLEGEFFEWGKDDDKIFIRKQGSYKNGKQHGSYVERLRADWRKLECSYANGELHGRWTRYGGYAEETIEIIKFYKMGKNDSTHTWFNVKTGKPERIERWKNHEQNGLSASYYADGKPEWEINYAADSKHGAAKEYYSDGQLSKVSNYVKGALHGEEILYYKSGKIKERRNYQMGKKFGKFVLYNEDGSIQEETEYGL